MTPQPRTPDPLAPGPDDPPASPPRPEEVAPRRWPVPGGPGGEEGDRLYVHARCHPEHAPWAFLEGDVLGIECSVCRLPVATFLLATPDGDEDPGDLDGEAEAWGEEAD